MKKKVLIASIIIIISVILLTLIWYRTSILPVDKGNTEKVEVEIPIGSTSNDISQILYNNNLIKSKLAFKVYVKLNKITDFQAGKYELYKTMDVNEISKTLQTGKLYVENQLEITFIEGKNMNWYAEEIEKKTNNTKEDVFELLQDEEYIDSLIDKYWFLTDEIKDENIYYPLEGYLFPDTYFFDNKDITVEEIFDTLLSQTEKVLNEFKDQIESQKYSVHEILTIASILETEGLNLEDRKNISSVVYNRLASKIPLQVDATTYYAIQVEMGSRDLTQAELNKYNPYNTRGPQMEGKLPIGPISSVGKDSIDAALNPNDTEYIFYVSDKNGKIYFNKTSEEHDRTILKLQEQDLWYKFE